MTKTIKNSLAIRKVKAQNAILIDVREPAEFREIHYPEAINMPLLTTSNEDYKSFASKPIYLVCQTGRRAASIQHQLAQIGIKDVYVLEANMQDISKTDIVEVSATAWTIDRQFRMTLGLLLLIFLGGYYFIGKGFIVIPMILTAGLIFTSIIDRCYMRIGIALLPWNRGKTS